MEGRRQEHCCANGKKGEMDLGESPKTWGMEIKRLRDEVTRKIKNNFFFTQKLRWRGKR